MTVSRDFGTGPTLGTALPRRTGALALAVALLATIPYAHTIGHGFAFDDEPVIVKNRFLTSLRRLPDLLTHGEWAGAALQARVYRPLTGATYAANHALGGLSPWGYHLVNVLLHGAAAAGVFLLATSWGVAPLGAFLGASLFAVHPIHVEAVANVVGRKDVLATLLLVVMALLHGRAHGGRKQTALLASLAYLGAMLAKETGAVGLALVAAQDVVLRARSGRRTRLLLYGGHAAALALYLGAYAHALGGIQAPDVPFVDNPAAHAPLGVRLLTAIAVIWKGLALQLFPSAQSPDYSYDSIALATSLADPRVVAALAAFAGWAALGLRLRSRAPAVALSLAWYAAPLFPASNLAFPVGTIFAERLLYASSVGSMIAVAIPLAGVLSRLRALGARTAVLAMTALLATTTVTRASAWKDETQLFEAAVQVVPRSAKVRVKLAELALGAGRAEQALAQARAAREILPNLERVRIVEAQAMLALGRTDEALALLLEELALTPGGVGALHATGALLRDQGRVLEAARYWEKALAVDPRHAATLADLGTYRLMTGELEAAERLLLSSVDSDPSQANAWYNLALLRASRGDLAGARAAQVRFVETAGKTYAAEADRIRAMLGIPR
jgi:Flp pilus assembly protein TadD